MLFLYNEVYLEIFDFEFKFKSKITFSYLLNALITSFKIGLLKCLLILNPKVKPKEIVFRFAKFH